MSQVLLAEQQDGVARLTLNRPDKRNALNADLIVALKAALRNADADTAIRVVMILGAGEDFCAGADLGALRSLANASTMENLADADAMAELFLLPRRMSKPVIAVVRGRALAGGCGLATACDLVVAAESAQFGYTEVRLGFVPGMVSAMLRRNVPEKRAFELLTRGHVIGAGEAERIGLINQVWADAELDERVRELVRDLAARSPSAVHLTKRVLYGSDGMTFEAALRAGVDANLLARTTDDMRASVARFLDKSRA